VRDVHRVVGDESVDDVPLLGKERIVDFQRSSVLASEGDRGRISSTAGVRTKKLESFVDERAS